MGVRGMFSVIGVVALLYCGQPVYAQSSPVATLFSEPVTEQDISPSAEQLSQLARMNSASKEMALAQYRHTRLSDTILEALLDDFASRHDITVDEQLVDRFKAKFADQYVTPQAQDAEQGEGTTSLDDVARKQVRRWQIDKALYQQYGGTVIFRQSNPQLPVGAYHALLKEAQQAGNFSILDDRYRALFWKMFEPPYTFELPPEQIDFSAPWWAKTDG